MNTDLERENTPKAYAHEEITARVLEVAFEVSNAPGCGFLEKAYENALLIR